MTQSLRNRSKARQRRVARRIDKANWNRQPPMLVTPAVQLKLADHSQGISAGGLGTVQQLCLFCKFHVHIAGRWE
jgi:hypothetical protein